MKYDCLKRMIENSRHLVCLEGIHISENCGCMNYRGEKDTYCIESKYGYSPEEMFHASFFNTRPTQFYRFYRQEMLNHPGTPNSCLRSLAALENKGILKGVITRELYSLANRAGCQNVIELHGNVYTYHCPRCGKSYGIEDILSSDLLPLCDNCQAVIRPGVAMIGDMLNNHVLSRAAALISHADVLLIIGCHMRSILIEMSLHYFQGSDIILIHEEPHYADSLANHVYCADPNLLLPSLFDPLENPDATNI